MTDKDRNVASTNPTSPKSEVFGREALNKVLSTINFPIAKLELVRQIGSQRVEYIKDHPVKLEDVINQCNCHNDRFDTRNDLIVAMCSFLDNRTEKSASKKV